MDTRKPIDAQAAGLMFVLCLTWALQQVLLKAAAVDISPMMQVALRSGISAVLVWLMMRWRGEPLDLAGRDWKPGLVVGLLFALEFLFVAEGIRHTTASHAAVFLYTAPIFVALALHWRLPSERLNRVQWTGILLAFAGVVLAFLWRGSHGSGGATLLGDFLVLVGAAGWAGTTVAVRLSSLANAPATRTLQYQLIGAFVVLLPAAWLMGLGEIRHTTLAWGSVLFQGILVSFASYLVWFWLLRKYLASRLGVFSFMTPLFGVALGVWLLGEPLEPGFVVGAVLVLLGILLVNGQAWLPRSRKAA